MVGGTNSAEHSCCICMSMRWEVMGDHLTADFWLKPDVEKNLTTYFFLKWEGENEGRGRERNTLHAYLFLSGSCLKQQTTPSTLVCCL